MVWIVPGPTAGAGVARAIVGSTANPATDRAASTVARLRRRAAPAAGRTQSTTTKPPAPRPDARENAGRVRFDGEPAAPPPPVGPASHRSGTAYLTLIQPGRFSASLHRQRVEGRVHRPDDGERRSDEEHLVDAVGGAVGGQDVEVEHLPEGDPAPGQEDLVERRGR